ncbi:flagellar motor switch phosphatase FliY [Halobacillus locisalis]|uniref:Flagellar motor switch phosphatase FliY n=1 Tax=Halobacillus locisalis TaxID=220753 RepID=A0A838CPP4_9BACI|nr:flagellar motor switch phosphatase FliY [Halobacillus locisalis]MBA2174102.1 flagellar motor switch phosphatase FliY [Halobacillus locisalis]
MNDDMLSQDEIDALLNGSDEEEETHEEQPTANLDDQLSNLEEDALGEIGNISFGSSATALSSLLNQKVDITTPQISVVQRQKLPNEFPKPHVAIGVTYTDGFSGENVLVIGSTDAAIIADLMLGGDGTSPDEHLNEIALSAVQEAMNQMMGSAATSMSTIFNKKVDISPPTIDVLNLEEDQGTEQIPDDEILVKVSFQLRVGELIDSNIMQLIPVGFAKDLVDQLLNPDQAEETTSQSQATEQSNPAGQQQTTAQPAAPQQQQQAPAQTETQQQQVPQQHTPYPNQQQAAPMYEQPPQPQAPQFVGGPQGRGVNDADIQSAQFQNFEQVQLSNNEHRNLDMLMDIPLKVTVELGRTKRTIKEILELSAGSVIELDKLAGEPVDIHVNEKLMAKGEVVVIDENFGVRVTDILSPKDRLSKLR